jgi:hypothetical protein
VFVVVIVGWGTATNLNIQTHSSFFSCVIVFSVDKSLTSLAQLKQMITEEVTVISPEMVMQAVTPPERQPSSWALVVFIKIRSIKILLNAQIVGELFFVLTL